MKDCPWTMSSFSLVASRTTSWLFFMIKLPDSARRDRIRVRSEPLWNFNTASESSGAVMKNEVDYSST